MIILEHYTSDFDRYENIRNDGLSGKTFVSNDYNDTKEYASLQEAIDMNADNLDQVIIYYHKDGQQMFKKFKLN